jgi:hypothetical protein
MHRGCPDPRAARTRGAVTNLCASLAVASMRQRGRMANARMLRVGVNIVN